MEQEQHLEGTTAEGGTRADGPTRMSRREALSLVGKHAVYTAPAVLAILAVTESRSAHAREGSAECSLG